MIAAKRFGLETDRANAAITPDDPDFELVSALAKPWFQIDLRDWPMGLPLA